MLKPSTKAAEHSRFYAATMGIKNGMHEWMRETLGEYDPLLDAFNPEGITFSLENGAEILGRHFREVEIRRYEDALAVTDVNDLAAWLRSTITLLGYSEEKLSGLIAFLEQKKDAQGILYIPKAVGVFIARKPYISPVL